MSYLKIAFDDALAARSGDFGAKIENDTLLLPANLQQAVAALGVRNSAEFISAAVAFPSFFMSELGWRHAELGEAVSRLAAQLAQNGTPPLAPAQRKQPSSGARPPRP